MIDASKKDLIQRYHELPEWLIVSTLMALVLAFRVWVMQFHYAVGWDEPHYLQMGLSIARGKFAQGLHPFWSPMYPVCIAVFSFIFRNAELAGRMVSLLGGVFLLLPVYAFARRLFGRTSALISMALLGFHPGLAFMMTSALAEPIYIFFSVMGAYAAWRALEKDAMTHATLAGLLFGASYLTRPEGIGFWMVAVGVAGIWFMVEWIQNRRLRKLGVILLFVFGFIALAGPYLAYLRQTTGRWTLSSKGFAVQQLDAQHYVKSDVDYGRLSADNTMLPKDAIYHEGNFMNLVGSNKQETRHLTVGGFLKKYARNFHEMVKRGIPQTFGAALFLLWGLGLFTSGWPREKILLHVYLLAFIGLFWFGVIPAFHVNERYLIPGLVICFTWMGRGSLQLCDWASAGFGWMMGKRVVPLSRGAVILLIVVFFWLPEIGKVVSRDRMSSDYWSDAIELKAAGDWLKANAGPSPVLMSLNKAVDFYAGIDDVRKGVSLSRDPYENIMTYARHKQVEYMVVAERYLRRHADLAFLFSDQIPELLTLVYEDDAIPDAAVRIFRLK